MPNTGLSESAVAVLHFKLQGLKVPVTEQRLPAFRELTAAGLMESVSDAETDFRFTEEGLKQGKEIARAEFERIERARYAPPDTGISDAAKDLLRGLIEGERVKVTPENEAAYCELAEARIMVPLQTFVGPTSYRFTYWGHKLRFELAEREPAEETASLG